MTDHQHHCHHNGAHASGGDSRRLAIALAVIAGFMVLEVIGGIISGSLALLADAGHMATDAVAIALALWARHLAARPSTPAFPFGLKRAQVLAAFVNGLALFLLIGFLLRESLQRMNDPEEIRTGIMMVVALLGLGANLIAFRILHRGNHDDVNMRGAILHVVGDMLGSVAAIIAAIVISLTGWLLIDPLMTVLVCGLIGWSAWGLIRDTTRVLLEAAPPGINIHEVRRRLLANPNVVDIHKLRMWMLTPDTPQLTMHVRVVNYGNANQTLKALKDILSTEFGIEQSTIQMECLQQPSVEDVSSRKTSRSLKASCPDDHEDHAEEEQLPPAGVSIH